MVTDAPLVVSAPIVGLVRVTRLDSTVALASSTTVIKNLYGSPSNTERAACEV